MQRQPTCIHVYMYMYILRMFDNVKTHADRYCTHPSHMAAVGLTINYYCGIVIFSSLPSPSFPCPSAVRAAIRLICATLSIHCSMPSFGVCSSTSPARENMMQLGLCTSTSHQIVMRLIPHLWNSVIYLKRARCLFFMSQHGTSTPLPRPLTSNEILGLRTLRLQLKEPRLHSLTNTQRRRSGLTATALRWSCTAAYS
jgi:hypothetical protein